jgi:hypothetical protein
MRKQIKGLLPNMQRMIDICEPGAGKELLQAQLDLVIERLHAYPKRVTDQGPFADRDEAEGVLMQEMKYVLAAMEPLD